VDLRSNGTSDNGPEALKARAARFDDEKRRLIESCFSKKDANGTFLEQYITHVRVSEDALYPSSPPPPNSDPSNKKNRIIMLAVRKSGRVTVNKARENPNGSFSIGKTWNLDDLTAIQIFDAFNPTTVEEQNFKHWAGPAGFIVTLGKPYFWLAPTSMEKEFFVGSLIKIYRKYTAGKIPDLIGFTQQEMGQMHIQSPRSTPEIQSASASPQSQPALPPRAPFASSDRPQSPYMPMAPGRDFSPSVSTDGSRAVSRNGVPPPQTREAQQTPQQTPVRDEFKSPSRITATSQMDGEAAQATPSFGRRRSPSVGQSSPAPPRIEDVPPMPTHLQVTRPQPPMNAKSSESSLQQAPPLQDPRLAKVNGAPSASQRVPPTQNLAVAPSSDSLRQPSEGGTSIDSSRPSTAASEKKALDPKPGRPPIPAEPLPDRKRAADIRPGINSDQRSIQSESSSKFATPVGTPSALRPEVRAPSRAGDKASDDSTGYFADKSVSSKPSQETIPPLNIEKSVVPSLVATPPVPAIPDVPSMTSEPEEMTTTRQSSEEHRPGLGPMVKKKSAKDIANTFRRAAMAANAFQPRAGGAAARFKAQQIGDSNEPDGITSVVPAPLLRGLSSDSARSGTPDVPTPMSEQGRPLSPVMTNPPPRLQVRSATEDSVQTQSSAKIQETAKSTPQSTEKRSRPISPDKTRSRSPARKRRQRQEAEIEKHCSVLGIDPRVLEGRGADFNDLLTEFGWEGSLPEESRIEDLEAEVRREIGRAQATGWLGHIEQQESKIQELTRSFEKAIEECEELDGLLTLYSHELDTLHDDIQYIEAQSQGLQVQTANQKLLQKELQTLLQTLNITSSDLRGLRSAPLDSPEGLQNVERSLTTLYRAMITIDPDMRQNKIRQAEGNYGDKHGVAVYADTDMGQMRAVKEKKDDYRAMTTEFLRRFSQHMSYTFKRADQRTNDENSRSIASSSGNSLDLKQQHSMRQDMWVYNPLLLFVREVNTYEWQTLITSYEMNVRGSYQDQFRETIQARKKAVRKTAVDDHEHLFTAPERDAGDSSVSMATRKLTVRRGKTIKSNALRKPTGEPREGGSEAWEAFDHILRQQAQVIAEEQNFVVHFFHANSQINADFAELVATSPNQRRLPNLQAKQSYDPDRGMAKIVQQTTESIYSFWPNDLQALVEWALVPDALQGVGVLCSIEQSLGVYEETNQEFITRTMRALHDRLLGLFHKFIDDQVRAIDDSKLKASKRKGILLFMRRFPLFAAAVENIMPAEEPNQSHHESLETRFLVNSAYTKILKTIWDCLSKFTFHESTTTGVLHNNAITEEKALLNHHILLIENMNHYIEEVDTHHNVVLDEWSEKAVHDLSTNLTAYTRMVIHRPMEKWMDFLDSTEAAMKNTSDYTTITSKTTHNRKTARDMLRSYDAPTVRKGIETLKRRIEKHFGDVDEGSVGAVTNKGLVARVFEECALQYAHAYDGMQKIIDTVYVGNDKDLEIGWRKEEVVTLFKK
jgi:exocyst complex component 1